MRQFTCYIGTAVYPVISFRRKTRYVNGAESGIKDSCYTVLIGYDQVDVTVPDEGNVVTYEQIKEAADAGTPLEMNSKSWKSRPGQRTNGTSRSKAEQLKQLWLKASKKLGAW